MTAKLKTRNYIVVIEQKFKPVAGTEAFPTEELNIAADSNAAAISEAREIVTGVLGKYPPPLKYTARLRKNAGVPA